MKKSFVKRSLGPGAKWMLRRAGKIRTSSRDLLCSPEWDYAAMLRDAMNFVKGAQMEGDYLEFGVSTGVTMSAAYRYPAQFGLDAMTFYAFDSFQGLPTSPASTPEAPANTMEGNTLAASISSRKTCRGTVWISNVSNSWKAGTTKL